MRPIRCRRVEIGRWSSMLELNPAGPDERAHSPLWTPAAHRDEMIVPRLRGVSHAAAFVVAVAAAVEIVGLARTGRATVAAAIYGIALSALFGGSALFHRWPGPARFRPALQRIDHSMIYVFIAASYTTIAVGLLHGALIWVI